MNVVGAFKDRGGSHPCVISYPNIVHKPNYHQDVEIHRGGACRKNVICATVELKLLKGGALRGGEASFSSSDEGDLPEIGVAAREGSDADIDVIQREELLIKDKAGGGGIRVDWD